mmetsp:Transcript_8216/g.27610  ORF Transcript_8216/g.27610 Transcript_8216/m.27610 type:complete len:94 (+) Transcript_8216:480-761(+)
MKTGSKERTAARSMAHGQEVGLTGMQVYDHNKADHSLAAKTRERTVQDNQEAIKMAEEAQRRMPAYPLAPQYMEEEAPAVRLVPSNPRRCAWT